ncbi:DUF6415 family natural product biosynthesis protein [Streptomyces sp. DK15]|uniref:DUF6415 family natural product biosynthesis protein n=1 Tax=Streptomyces sp. DK15 TaxID=2957499 RepID=UPI0029A76C36|nr:DUF6415 family natural product biosynthesis protein [Streptomyces sp. DK15]MDX2394109.1 DUF6415 family natural product biosynthesis protein [Streptomyces sp. DK15]
MPQGTQAVVARRLPRCDESEATVIRVLEALRPGPAPAILASLFEALEDILGPDSLPDDDAIADLRLLMRGHLMRLLGVVPERQDFTDLAVVARALLDAEVPGDYMGIRVHLRRMALAALDLLDMLDVIPVPDTDVDHTRTRDGAA